MSYTDRREKLFESMEENAALILYSGNSFPVSADEYTPFEANRHFFYLTGIRRENMVLVMTKHAGKRACALYIEKTDPFTERWTGKMMTPEEAKAVSGIEDIRYTAAFERDINTLFSALGLKYAYFDLYRNRAADEDSFNILRAKEFSAKYPGASLLNLWPLVTRLRTEKDGDEIEKIRKAIRCTDEGLNNVLSRLAPGRYEYQAQADFEYTLHMLGADGTSFATIAGSGKNGTMMHYETNRDLCGDGTLLLLDLGCKWEGYCSDITRTYPVNGKYTERQRAVYDIVLEANREVKKAARPGVTLAELNDVCKKVLAAGCIRLGLIRDESEIGKYYMHSVSHHLGIDVHDVSFRGEALTPGCVITDEPGLYIDEWETGIRIEDDLLITETGCECLSEQIIRDAGEIEKYMKEHKKAE